MVRLVTWWWGGWWKCSRRDGKSTSSLVLTASFSFHQVSTDFSVNFQLLIIPSESSWWRASQTRCWGRVEHEKISAGLFYQMISHSMAHIPFSGGWSDLSRSPKHLPGWIFEHAHKKSQIWQAWPRLPCKVTFLPWSLSRDKWFI